MLRSNSGKGVNLKYDASNQDFFASADDGAWVSKGEFLSSAWVIKHYWGIEDQ